VTVDTNNSQLHLLARATGLDASFSMQHQLYILFPITLLCYKLLRFEKGVSGMATLSSVTNIMGIQQLCKACVQGAQPQMPEYRPEDMVFEMEEEKIPMYNPPKPEDSGDEDDIEAGARQEHGDTGGLHSLHLNIEYRIFPSLLSPLALHNFKLLLIAASGRSCIGLTGVSSMTRMQKKHSILCALRLCLAALLSIGSFLRYVSLGRRL